MQEDEFLGDHFFFPTEHISALRAADETFDTICKDYMSLSREAARVAEADDPTALRYLADVRESLAGLSKEIETRLRRFCSTNDFKL